ncbi:MAG: BCCT family transporter [Halioglobus sp.]
MSLESDEQNVDKTAFFAAVVVILLVSAPLLFAPEAAGRLLLDAYAFVANQFGVLYIIAGCATLIFLAWLAFSRYGSVVLGESGVAPEFSTYSWIGMLFCAGIGAGLMYWACIEWAFYYQSPPYGVEPKSVDAARWASTYGVFHWGFTAWAFYCLPTLAIAYPFYVRKVPVLKFSISCDYFFRGNEKHPAARLLDFLFMIALIGGAGSSLGFSTPLIASLISRLTGVEMGFGLEAFVVGLCVSLFAISVYLGLKKGIKRLSDFNLALAFILVVFVFLAGPTLFLLKAAVTSIGTMLQNFVQMNTWTDPFTESRFVEDWTVFYWAWWIAYGPFVGLFVTRISRGRTIREVILGMLFYGSLGVALFYLTLGNYALFLETSGQLAVVDILNDSGGNQAIIASLETLPWGELVIAMLCVVAIIFCATTYDSASYILAANATSRLHPSEDPPRWHRAFWAVALAILPISLMYAGGIKMAQTMVLLVSLPLLAVGVLMSVSLVKSLQEDHAVK